MISGNVCRFHTTSRTRSFTSKTDTRDVLSIVTICLIQYRYIGFGRCASVSGAERDFLIGSDNRYRSRRKMCKIYDYQNGLKFFSEDVAVFV